MLNYFGFRFFPESIVNEGKICAFFYNEIWGENASSILKERPMKRCTWIIILLLILPVFSQALREVERMPIPENFEDLIDPKSCAVIVVDMQNNWISTEGMCVQSDKERKPDLSKHEITPSYAEQVKNMQKFLKGAREAGVLITYAEFIHTNTVGSTLMSGWTHYYNCTPNAVENTWGAKTVAELAPQKGDYVILKSRGNAFYKTYLEDILRERQIRTIFITGTATGGCVAATTFGAFERAFYPVMVRDCIDQHESLFFKWMEKDLPMHTSDEIIATWNKMKEDKKAEEK